MVLRSMQGAIQKVILEVTPVGIRNSDLKVCYVYECEPYTAQISQSTECEPYTAQISRSTECEPYTAQISRSTECEPYTAHITVDRNFITFGC
jgi:hypothetical protein